MSGRERQSMGPDEAEILSIVRTEATPLDLTIRGSQVQFKDGKPEARFPGLTNEGSVRKWKQSVKNTLPRRYARE